MVVRATYEDFKFKRVETRTVRGNDVEYSMFSCPYPDCKKLVAVPHEDVVKQKSSRCYTHLVEQCQDPQVDKDRRQSVRDARASKRAVKRQRAVEASPEEDNAASVDTTLATRNTELVSQNDRLVERNDLLRATKDTLQSNMDRVQEDMQRMKLRMDECDAQHRHEISLLRTDIERIHKWQADVSVQLGLSADPIPDVLQCLQKIKTDAQCLRKERGEKMELEKRNNALKIKIDSLELGRDDILERVKKRLNDKTKIIQNSLDKVRSMERSFHPDKAKLYDDGEKVVHATQVSALLHDLKDTLNGK